MICDLPSEFPDRKIGVFKGGSMLDGAKFHLHASLIIAGHGAGTSKVLLFGPFTAMVCYSVFLMDFVFNVCVCSQEFRM